MAKKRILVVDDNEYLLKAWERILEGKDCTYTTTTNPQAALQYLEDEGADILISDIVMPQIDGFDLIQKSQRSGSKMLKIVLTTGYACDFGRIKLDMPPQSIHVLLKPYNDLGQVEAFVQRLIDDDETLENGNDSPLQRGDDVKIQVWSL